MAYSTANFQVKASDSWTLVATNPTYLHVKPSSNVRWEVALVPSGTPAAGTEGISFGRVEEEKERDYFELNLSATPVLLVYVRISPQYVQRDVPVNFSVAADQ